MDYNKEEILALFDTEESITNTARKYCELHGIEYNDSIRRKFSKIINKYGSFSNNDTDSNNYSNDVERPKVLNAFDENGKLMNIDEYCETYGLDRSAVRSFKLISHTGIPYYNIVFYENSPVEDITKDEKFLEDLVKKYLSEDTETYFYEEQQSTTIDRLILSDIHINMDNTGGKNVEPIFNNPVYNKEEIFRRLDLSLEHVFNFGISSDIIVDNLGDFMDGFMGTTTRGGHKLPQLMSDKDAFDLAVGFQIRLVESLLEKYDTVTLNNIINDNHSFLMGYFVHSGAKQILEAKYPGRVFYYNHERFISHYKAGKHTFILTHGKDATDMKFGMKLQLDSKIIEKIDQYCKEYGLYDGNNIELSKGDLHACVIDYTTASDFEYVNYPAFSPPSNWVQTNFGNTKSGVVLQILDMETKDKIVIPKWF